MYLCSATLKRYEDEGRQPADAPLMHWAIWDAMFKAQNAFEGVISQFPEPVRGGGWRASSCFPLGRPYVVPSDRSATRSRAADRAVGDARPADGQRIHRQPG